MSHVIAFSPNLKMLHFKKIHTFWPSQCCYYSMNSLATFHQVLSKENRQNCLKLLQAKTSIVTRNKANVKKAAVLVPLCNVNDKVALLYTVRAPLLKVNGGQVSFPGGMKEDNDRSLKETALREAFEEVGLNPERVDIWGSGYEIYRADFSVTPFLGYIGNYNFSDLKINSQEVSTVFPATLNHLSNPINFRTTQFRHGKTHVYITPVYLTEPKKIWGLTAMITHIILSALIPDIYTKNIRYRPSFNKKIGNNNGF